MKAPSRDLLFALRASLHTPPSRHPHHFPHPRARLYPHQCLQQRPPQYLPLKRRSITTWYSPSQRFRQALTTARNDHPILLPTLLLATIGSISLLGLLLYDSRTRIAPQFAAYPPAVEQQLRLALHFTHVSPDPDAAADRFVKALKAAEECGMDAFGKEVMGIRVRLAECLEGFGRCKGAVEVLNGIVTDCEERLVDIDRGVLLKGRGVGDGDEQSTDNDLRRALLRGIIQAKSKIATLYVSEYLQDPAQAKRTLADAIQVLVSETQDPQNNGFSEGNRAGLSLKEIAALLLQMGDLYATSGEEINAVQVYMLTLDPLRKSCGGVASCKEAQVLSNIASAMALAIDRPGATVNGQVISAQNVKAARKASLAWADKAVSVVESVKPGDGADGDEEICKLALLSAQMTKADLLAKDGRKVEAREVWRSVLPVLRENDGMVELLKVAEEGLKRTVGE